MRVRLAAAAAVVVAGIAVHPGAQAPDAERQMHEQLQFTTEEIAQARQGQPVVRLLPSSHREDLAVAGAVRIDGDPARLAQWIESIEHFRSAAQLGLARVIPSPVTSDAFAQLTLDAADVEDLRACRPDHCVLRVTTDAVTALQGQVRWDTAAAPDQASGIVRDMLAGFTRSYAAGQAPQARAAFHELLARAPVFRAVAPELVEYFDRFPSNPPETVKTLLYWSVMPLDRGTEIAVHHVAISRRAAADIVIVDRVVYASRYFDAAALVVTMAPAPTGGYYMMVGSRLESPDLGGFAARVARRKIEQAAMDFVRMYVGWLRDSLALPPAR